MARQEDPDEVLAALDALLDVIADPEPKRHMEDRARVIIERRRAGAPYSEIVEEAEQSPLIVEVLSAHIDDLIHASARFRRAEAAALHLEGLTMDQIAELFGVTRQRVSTLVREARESGVADALRESLRLED